MIYDSVVLLFFLSDVTVYSLSFASWLCSERSVAETRALMC